MSEEIQQLKALINKAGEIQTGIRITSVKYSPGANVISGDHNTTYVYQKERFTQEFASDISSLIEQLKDEVNTHKEDLTEPDDVLSNLGKIERELTKDEPDAPTILGRMREVAQAVVGVAVLVHLATQALGAFTSLFTPR